MSGAQDPGRVKRTVKIVAAVLVGLLGLVLLLVGTTFAMARTTWGAERIRRFALPRLNAAFAGQVDVQHFRFLGDRVLLEGLTLRDPDGELVAGAKRVDVAFSPVSLLRRRLHLGAVTIDQPMLSFRQYKTGQTNLGRALAGKVSKPIRPPPAPSKADEQGAPFAFDLGALTIREATIDVRDDRVTTAAALRHVRVVDLNMQGAGRYQDGGGAFGLKLDGRGEAMKPLRAPLALAIDGSGRLAGTDVDASGGINLTLGESTVQLRGEVQSVASPPRKAVKALQSPPSDPVVKATINLQRVRIVPALVRVLSPTSPLKAAVNLSGHATWDGVTNKGTAKLDLAAAGATVTINASADLARRSIQGLSMRARDINLARLVEEGPPSALSFDVEAHGEGHNLATLRGAATLRVPPGRLGGYPIGPVRLRVDADQGRYKVMDLVAVIPGVSISGAGEATAKTLAFRGVVDLRDLGATVRSVTAGRSSGSPRAGGRGRIDLALAGNPGAPTLKVKGRLFALRWQDIRVPTLEIAAEIPDVRQPLASSLNLKVPQADVGNRHFQGLAVTVHATGPRFDAQLSLTAPEALHLNAAGTWGPKRSEIVFQHLGLRSRHASWKSVKPVQVVFRDDLLRVAGLDLRGEGAQQVSINLEKRGPSVRADALLSAVDLAKLPESLLPPKLRLAGRLTAEIHAKGRRADRAVVDARVTLADGRVGNLRDIDLDINARIVDRRVAGRLDLGVLGARIAGTFDAPVVWPPPSAAVLAANLQATNIDFQRVTDGLTSAQNQLASGASTVVVAKPRVDVRGNASWKLQVGGTGAVPEVTFQADVRNLKVKGTAVGNVKVDVDAPGKKPITARVELRTDGPAGAPRTGAGAGTGAVTGAGAGSNAGAVAGAGVPKQGAAGKAPGAGATPPAAAAAISALQGAGPSVVTLRTGFWLGSLIHRPPSTKAMLATPVHLEAHIVGVKLAPLVALTGSPLKVGGTASLEAVLDGTSQAARGNVALTLADVSSGRFPPTDGAFNVQLGQRDVRANARVTRRGTTMFEATARLSAPAARLRDVAALPDVPVELHAVLGPLDLQRVGLPPETDRNPARILKGRLRAQADVTGTLRAPRVNLRADASDIRLDQTPIGGGVIVVTYANRKAAADAQLVSANGGRLHVAASTTADFGYPAITRGFDARRLPIAARLDAKGFDIAGLSGAAPGLRVVAGQIFAAVQMTGTVADPRPSGRFEWKDGGLTITGMGEYKRIHLLAHGDKDHLVLDELRAESGGGSARITARGDHSPDAGYAVKADMKLDKFPAYVEGQALAAISLEATADSKVSVERVRARIAISSARVALSDAKRKHLQKLAGPGDVVLTDDSAPLNAAQARKLAAVNAALAPPADRPADAAAGAGRGTSARPAGVVVTVDAPRNLWVNGEDANVELGLLPKFRVEITDATRVYGTVVVKRGRVDVVGRRFDLKSGSSARFGGLAAVPELDVSAVHKNEKERITVLVTAKGPPDRLQIGITAPERPDLTETQLYTLVVTGRLTFGGGTASSATPTNRAASLVGGLMAAQLQKSLSKKLPFDVLTIEAGEGVGTARLEAGTYVTSDLYVGYVGRLGANPALLQNRNAVHLEYELGSRWSFEGEYGDAKTGSADMMWTNRY